MALSQVGLPEQMLAHLELARWNALADAERYALALALTERFQSSRLRLFAPRLERHGPNEEQAVALWHDETARLDYALIPGGMLLPGYEKGQLERYTHIYTLVEGWRDEMDEEEDAYETEDDEAEHQEAEAETLERTQIFASQVRCDIRRKPAVQIEPFLMAVTPLLATTPGIAQVAPKPEWWSDNSSPNGRVVLTDRLRWPHIEPVLRHYGIALPTSAEYEWALSGGLSSLFYWGDDVPAWVIDPPQEEETEDEQAADSPAVDTNAVEGVTSRIPFSAIMLWGYDANHPRLWPYCNRFGLIGMAAWRTWCEPTPEPADPFPLVLRGGASDCYPWQACGEWKSLLNAVEGRVSVDTNYGDWNALRPIIRLHAQA